MKLLKPIYYFVTATRSNDNPPCTITKSNKIALVLYHVKYRSVIGIHTKKISFTIRICFITQQQTGMVVFIVVAVSIFLFVQVIILIILCAIFHWYIQYTAVYGGVYRTVVRGQIVVVPLKWLKHTCFVLTSCTTGQKAAFVQKPPNMIMALLNI